MNAVLAPRRRRSISLTALIDVVFILLMFFMLTSTFSQWQGLSLTSASADSHAATSEPQLVLIYADGRLRVLHDSLSPVLTHGSLVTALTAGVPTVISAEESATLQQITAVAAVLGGAGVSYSIGQPFSGER